MKGYLVMALLFVPMIAAGCITEKQNIGGAKDKHGCLIAAGYSWCESKQKCLREWEQECPSLTALGCIDKCGDGKCAEIVCMAAGCPCAETPESCPEDCI